MVIYETYSDYKSFKVESLKKFKRTDDKLWREQHTLHTRKQLPAESADEYISAMITLALQANASKSDTRKAIMSNIRPTPRHLLVMK